MTKRLVQIGIYPLIMGSTVLMQWYFLTHNIAYFPWSLLSAGVAIGLVALSERWLPYHADWLQDHQDTVADILHALVSLSLIFATFYVVRWSLSLLSIEKLWPHHWHPLAQLLLAGVFIDFGMWLMHWLSHKNRALWQLHALHHSSTRLYWLNGERRHPLSAIILGAPGVLTVFLLGADAKITGAWMVIVAVHLSFQHANLDYRLGPFSWLVAGAQMHRWHHKKAYENAQVNFGECFLIWDHLFGTFYSAPRAVGKQDVGMSESMPTQYLAQLSWPFKSADAQKALLRLSMLLVAIVTILATLVHAFWQEVSLFHGIILHPLFLLAGLLLIAVAHRRGKKARCHYSSRTQHIKENQEGPS